MRLTTLTARFTSAPIITIPDPAQQFIVEVDASDIGVGAIFSQRSSSDQKLLPGAFFSRHMNPAERNYDIDNHELLAVKLALEEWLEGAEQPFTIWTDHRSLKYIKAAKCLSSCQVQWALFFTHFNFTCPTDPAPETRNPTHSLCNFRGRTPSLILPSTHMVAAVIWSIEDRVGSDIAAHSSCPTGKRCPRQSAVRGPPVGPRFSTPLSPRH